MTKYYNEKCQAWCTLDEETKKAIRASDCVEYMGCYGEWNKSTMKGVFCSGGIFRAPKLTEAELFLEKWKGEKIAFPNWGINGGRYFIAQSADDHGRVLGLNHEGKPDYICNLGDHMNWQLWEEPEHIPLGPEDIKQGDAVRVKGLEANEKIWVYIEPYSCNDVMKVQSRNILSFESLMHHYEIRSIGETEWRPCSKESK